MFSPMSARSPDSGAHPEPPRGAFALPVVAAGEAAISNAGRPTVMARRGIAAGPTSASAQPEDSSSSPLPVITCQAVIEQDTCPGDAAWVCLLSWVHA